MAWAATPAPKRRAVCMAKSGLELSAKASWVAGRSPMMVAGGADVGAVEPEVSDAGTATGLVVAVGTAVVLAEAWGALREASREAVASWARLALPLAGATTGNRVAACRALWNIVWARSWMDRAVAPAVCPL